MLVPGDLRIRVETVRQLDELGVYLLDAIGDPLLESIVHVVRLRQPRQWSLPPYPARVLPDAVGGIETARESRSRPVDLAVILGTL
ncbi:hypothetical protein GCM10027267_14650 [Paramicrobacterium agarici]